MESQIPENVFNNCDSFMSTSSTGTKKTHSGLRKSGFERLYAHVDRRTDVLWQEKPARVLAYKASAVHQYGWIPLNPFKWRNVKATVFSSVLLNVQTVVLVGWALIIHTTGLGMHDYDIRAFLKIWGTVYAGAVFNLATVVVFILGLFTSLVINRWWSIRTAYAKFVSACSDLTMMSAVNVRDSRESHGARAARARLELVRLINLTHVLVCIMADSANKVYAKSSIESWWEELRGKRTSTEGEHTFGRASMHTLGYQELCEEGLVNEDEWETILANEAYGMPRYMTVMYWVEALLHKCKEKGVINPTQQTIQAMTTKVGAISDSASSIFTLIRSQMPYPYVHLVSFTVHFYLFFWATYMGALLNSGIPDGSVTQSGPTSPFDVTTDGVSADDAWESLRSGDQVTTTVRHAHRADGWFNLLWAYVTIAFANAVFQGLLNIHVLLDNPYGDHCTKFPLRAQIVELLNASRTMLSFTDQLPSVVAAIFTRSDSQPRVSEDAPEITATNSIVKPATESEPDSRRTDAVPTAALGSKSPSPKENVQDSPAAPVQASPQELGKMSEKALSQVAEALIQDTRRHTSSSSTSRPVETSAVQIKQHSEQPLIRGVAARASTSPVELVELHEPPVEHLFMQRARSIDPTSPYAPSDPFQRSPSQPRSRLPSSQTTTNRKVAILSRMSAPFRLLRSQGGQSSPCSVDSQSHPLSATVPRSKVRMSPRGHNPHVRFKDDATLTTLDGTSQQEGTSSDMAPDETVSFTDEAHTSVLLSSNSPRMHVHSQNIPDTLGGVAPPGASDMASTSHLMRLPSPLPRNIASEGSMLGQYVSDVNCPTQSPAARTTARLSGSVESSELPQQSSLKRSSGANGTSTHAQELRITPCTPEVSTPDCNTDASESPLAQSNAPTRVHRNVRTGDMAATSSLRDSQSYGGVGSLDNDSLTLNMPVGVTGVGVESHVLEHVVSSRLSVPSLPSGSSSASEQRKDKTLFTSASSSTPPQSLGSTKSRRGFPPLVPTSQPLSTIDTASTIVSVTSLVEGNERGNERENAALFQQHDPRSSTVHTQAQQSTPREANAGVGVGRITSSSVGAGAGGRRWFRMFGSPGKAAGADSANSISDSRSQDAAAASVNPQEMPGLPLQQQADRRQSATLNLQGSGAIAGRHSDGAGAGQAGELARMTSEAAQRRVGPHAVFNPTTMMNPGDAKFLDEVQLMRREGPIGPQATSSTSAGLAAAQFGPHDDARPSGRNTAITQQQVQPETMQPSSDSSLMLSRVTESELKIEPAAGSHKKAFSSVSIGSSKSPTEKTVGSRSGRTRSDQLDESSSEVVMSGVRHFFQP